MEKINKLYKKAIFRFYRGLIPAYNPDVILSQIPSCGILLSIGGGTGEIESTISIRGTRVLNHDISIDMLKGCENRNLVEGVNGTAEFLPYRDSSIDYILINESIGYMKLPETLRESYRVLKRDGKLMINTYKPTLRNRTLKYLNPVSLNYKIYPKERFEETIKDAGFKDIRIDEFDVQLINSVVACFSIKATK